ncbi:MAG: cellulase family glycosylhydrolase [Myxococcota bacterium]|jgi:endoglycosylceramidase|nr:cellulase family glycosylhydrolase [Myxococcota bacterium]
MTISLLLGACKDEPTKPSTLMGAPYSTDGKYIRDAGGAAILLRGTNISQVSKAAPYHPTHMDEEGAIETLNANGPIAIRYLTSWAAIEPEDGVYDEEYLAGLKERVTLLAEHGHYIVLDLHQDVFGIGFVGGNGAPVWACEQSYYDAYEKPDGPWFLAYFESEIKDCYDHLFGSDELLLKMAKALREAAEVVKEAAGDNFIGIDLINEPSNGNRDFDDFDPNYLQRYYLMAAEELKHLDVVLLFEPNAFHNIEEAMNFTKAPANGVYAPHFYPAEGEIGAYSGDIDYLDTYLYLSTSEAKILETPLVFGEFGPWSDDPKAIDFIRDFYELINKEFAGSFHWEYSSRTNRSPLNETCLEKECPKELFVPHARRVAGTPTSYTFDPETSTLNLCYNEMAASLPTEITLPESWYPDELEITVSDGSYAREGRLLKYSHDYLETEHCIEVKPGADE